MSSKPAANLSPVPPGAFLELNTDLIDEGKFRQRLDGAIRKAFEELVAYEKISFDSTGQAVITAKISLKRAPNTDGIFDIINQVKVDVPIVQSVSSVKQRGDKLLCQPTGASEHDPNQQVLFDGSGKAIGDLNLRTGELDEHTSVAGRVGAQA